MSRLQSHRRTLLTFVALAGVACKTGSVDARRVFPDSLNAALAEAVADGNKSRIQTLIKAGADPNARGDQDPSYLDILLAHKADPNTPNGVTGATPLVPALMGDRDVQFAKLLAAGAQPNIADRMGNTPLHVAGKINAFDRVLDLLEAGADPTARNGQGKTFQTYVNMTPADVMTEEALRKRAAIAAWLRSHNVPVEAASTR